MELKINNNTYKIFFVNPDDKKIQIEDEDFNLGITDFTKKEIYIANNLNKDTLRYTLIHELTHAVIDSYGFLQVEWNDEIIADFMGNYLLTILELIDEIENKEDNNGL